VRVAVSGGHSGIGAALADEGRLRGWEMKAGSRRSGLDVRDEASLDAFFAPGVDAAVNCAGISIDSLFVTMPSAASEEVLDTNLNGAFLFARSAIRNGAKSILFVGSLHQLGAPANAVYAASKAALAGLARAFDDEYPQTRTNVLVPGFVVTPMSAHLPDAVQEALCAASPLGRAVLPAEVARAAADLLVSPLRGRVFRAAGGLLETPR
jgi:3-oxoacyl-[acyl-carrier protein] reductase